ncbi:peptide alpha-N-acetyltransferase subunit NAT5 NDAI_0E01060 [Naumovozyma dairenensis CBS 421]|uniref:N-acetyltransferase domain-containing protein n=1 Tax=Naumovozyma dairenensis (strain ATCC 10597 / BCRC 20456 / CBS 421 / NBRC 0211 / NRRL Y-12639) TaxID=1071378 RepID=G0WB02_NAUDC|nr:hypothetical protein NDAI_0E01060 [Naumovozyma dairenensis CBS 421]CCD24922.1 hypothetical protein NDAI_0E01060 [Naumovozyma dairenensis CBS 421]
MGRDIVGLDNVYENNLGVVVKLAAIEENLTFPETFFQELFPKGNAKKETFFTQLAYYSEIPVGCVKAKLFPKKKSDIFLKGVHIEFMTVLEQYRGNQIGTKLLNYIEEQCQSHHQHNVYVHVPTDETNKIEWYKNHGFEIDTEVSPLQDFFKDFQPKGSADAVLLKKHIA